MPSDLRFAARSLSRQRALFATAALLLAVGIGANTVFFSVIDALLLRPLPVRDPASLVRFVQVRPNLGPRGVFPEKFYRALRDHSRLLASVFAMQELNFAFSTGDTPIQVRTALVSENFFATLGVPAAIG